MRDAPTTDVLKRLIMSGDNRRRRGRRSLDVASLGALSPSNIGDTARSTVASLIGGDDADEPKPRAHTNGSGRRTSGGVDVNWPNQELELYFDEYEQNPIINTQLNAFASDVFEPGYWLEADSEKTKEELMEFLKNIGIQGGIPRQPFASFGKMALIQNQARGTFLGEKVTDDKGRHIALNPANPAEMKIYTKPGVSLLLPPNYESDNDAKYTTKETPDGQSAAYVQFDQAVSHWSSTDRDERRFTRDQLIHWPRQPDIGDVFGHSVVEPVYERSRSLREKLQDNDLAIAMKAWPMILFELGEPDRPWSEDRQDSFMESYTKEQLGPGMFHGVPGDVEVTEFAGETADIDEYVETDVDMIVSAMPGPKHALGAFSADPGLADAHNNKYRKKVRDTRNDIENIFTPYLKQVAESWGYDPSGVELNIGRPEGEVAPEDVQGSIIRYQSDANDPQTDDNPVPFDDDGDLREDIREQKESEDDTGDERNKSVPEGDDDAPTYEENTHADSEATETTLSAPRGTRQTVHSEAISDLSQPTRESQVTTDVANLSDPRLVSTTDIERTLRAQIGGVFVSIRDDALSSSITHDASTITPDRLESEFSAQFESALREDDIDAVLKDSVEQTYRRTISTLEQGSHYPKIQPTKQANHGEYVADTISSIKSDLRVFANNVAAECRTQAERSDYTSTDTDVSAAERIRSVYDSTTFQARVLSIVQMRLTELINRVKRFEYKRDDECVGVTVIHPCSATTHELTASLAGCGDGDPVTARFDTDTSLGTQFQDGTDVDPPTGFDPLPDLPPFHAADQSELGPVYESDL